MRKLLICLIAVLWALNIGTTTHAQELDWSNITVENNSSLDIEVAPEAEFIDPSTIIVNVQESTAIAPTVQLEQTSEGKYDFYESIPTEVINIPYMGSVYNVDFYGGTPAQIDSMLPWVQQMAEQYVFQDLSIIVANDLDISINKINMLNKESGVMLDKSQSYLGQIDGLTGQYRADGNIIVIDGSLSPHDFQLTLLHEIGHYMDTTYGRPSNNLTDDDIQYLYEVSQSVGSPKDVPIEYYTQTEAFAELFMLQQCGVLPVA